jgi:hypothetical protein
VAQTVPLSTKGRTRLSRPKNYKIKDQTDCVRAQWLIFSPPTTIWQIEPYGAEGPQLAEHRRFDERRRSVIDSSTAIAGR